MTMAVMEGSLSAGIADIIFPGLSGGTVYLMNARIFQWEAQMGKAVVTVAVFRVEKNTNYTTMCNYHLRDQNLSLKAKGLLSGKPARNK